jgi:hypothetical protein
MKTTKSVWARAWLGVAAAMSGLCLVVTFFERDLIAVGAPQLLRSFSLRSELSIGAWWSGTLLLLASVHAADGYFWRRRSAPQVAYAWASLSFVLLCLSADEVGSMHERIGDVAGWWGLAPFGALLGGAWIFAMTALWRDPANRANAGWASFALLLLASVAGQEFLEHNTRWWGERAGLRVAVEEGTEMIALLILLRVGMSQSGGVFQSTTGAVRPVFQALASWRAPIAVIALVASPILAAVSAVMIENTMGLPVIWLVGSVFFLAALTLLRRPLMRLSWTWAHAAIVPLCVALSGAAVAMSPSALPRRSHIFTTTALLCIWCLWLVASKPRNREPLTVLAAFGAAMLALTWVEKTSLTLTFTAYAVAGASVLYAMGFLASRERAGIAANTFRTKLFAAIP